MAGAAAGGGAAVFVSFAGALGGAAGAVAGGEGVAGGGAAVFVCFAGALDGAAGAVVEAGAGCAAVEPARHWST